MISIYIDAEFYRSSGPWYYIRSYQTGLVVDIPGHNQGKQLIMWTPHGGNNQLWRWSNGRILSKTGLAMDISGADYRQGAKVIAWPSHGRSNQKWYWSGWNGSSGWLKSSHSGFVLDINVANQ